MMRFWLVLALVSGSVALTWRNKIDSLTPRKGRHRGAGRGIRGHLADHRGQMYGVWFVLRQSTRGLVAVGNAAVPAW